MLEGKCPLFTKNEIGKMMRSKNIVNRVRAYRKLEIDSGIVKKSIKEHFKMNKTEMIDGKRIGFEASLSYKYDLVKYIEYCRLHNIPLDGLTISKTEAERNINKVKFISRMTEEELRELEAIRVGTASSKFNL